MTAQASATHVLGRAVAADALAMSERDMRSVIVLTESGLASAALRRMASALDIELVTVRSFHDLPFQLHHHRPIGVVLELSPVGQACRSALRSVAAYDPDMHVLMVSGDDPAVLGAIDVAEQLWGLSALHRLTGAPEPADLIGFLFEAGRRSGLGCLMPVG
jgi:hypothetical protein